MKIDVSQIEGYADMTPEQKLEALEKHEFSGYVPKSMLDKTASEAAEWKKKHNALLSEDERAKNENADAMKKLTEEVELLRKEKQVSSYKASFLALGYDEKSAEAGAEALHSGDMQTVFKLQGDFITGRDKALRAELLKSTPRPQGGGESAPNYDKMIADAQARKDAAAEAYYTRLKAMSEAR